MVEDKDLGLSGGTTEETRKEVDKRRFDKQRFDALWWVVLVAPVLWWIAMLVLVIMAKIGWGVFISTGVLFQGTMYVIQALLRMLIRPLGRGYSKGHFIGFLIVGVFWVALGIVLIFVTKGL